MAASDLIPTLQTAVASFNTVVDTKQAIVDAKVASAQTALTSAQTNKDLAKSALDAARLSRNDAYRDLSSAKANLGYQDLAALAASKAVTAVDVFVYDTSKDSDGGAWRKRCTKTSWYNETLNTSTRGGRREFPAVAVIVAEAARVTIYDGDDPALPMWMVLAGTNSATILPWAGGGSSFSGVYALNGTLAISSLLNNGLAEVRFLADTGYVRNLYSAGFYNGNIAQRNDALGYNFIGTDKIAAQSANDVAMTVLPDAPIDPATGLPTPTIAVATGGNGTYSVSLIKDDGNVYDIVPDFGGYSAIQVSFDGPRLFVFRQASVYWVFNDVSKINSDGYNADIKADSMLAKESWPYGNGYQSAKIAKDNIFVGYGTTYSPLHKFDHDHEMVAYTTSAYNTGWMPGDIKGAFLADTTIHDETVGNELIDYPNVDQPNVGWYESRGGTLNYDGDGVLITNTSAYSGGFVVPLGMKTGDILEIDLDIETFGFNSSFYGGGYTSGYVLFTLPSGRTINNYIRTITHPSPGTLYLTIPPGGSMRVRRLSAKKLSNDRSVANKPLNVVGTINRTPVATGAELVGYSGFSASNYLEQPYNSDLDFGTGDFCIMGWFNGAGAASNGAGRTLAARRDPTGAGNWWELLLLNQNSNGELAFSTNSGTNLVTSNITHSVGSWGMVAVVRSGGTLSLYFNGTLRESVSNNHDLTNANGEITVGVRNDTGTLLTPLTDGSLALLRISATAPSADQVKKIYEDEKVLFQENAACTLYGTSDAVTALAHDPDTNLLHVGTPAGRSVFQGLRRIDNTTTPVTTAISASNGMVIEQ